MRRVCNDVNVSSSAASTRQDDIRELPANNRASGFAKAMTAGVTGIPEARGCNSPEAL